LEGEREDGQERLVVGVDQGQVLHERGPHVHAAKSRIDQLGRVNRGIDRRVWEQVVEDLQDKLGAAHLIQVVVDDGKFHTSTEWKVLSTEWRVLGGRQLSTHNPALSTSICSAHAKYGGNGLQ